MSGVFGITLDRDCREDTKRGAAILQHRGDECSGFAIRHKDSILPVTENKTKIKELFKKEEFLKLGETRQLIASLSQKDRQPVVLEETRIGPIALVVDGKIINKLQLQEKYPHLVGTDPEIFIRIVASGKDPLDGIKTIYELVQGPFSLVLYTFDGIFAARDILGLRPLITGRFLGEEKIGCAVTSESVSLKHMGMKITSDIKPGEIAEIASTGFRTLAQIPSPGLVLCGFELGYWGRPSSVIDDISVWAARYRSGMKLAPICPKGHIITSIPISGNTAAEGLHYATRIPFRSVFDFNIEAGGRSFLPFEAEDRTERARDKLLMIDPAVFSVEMDWTVTELVGDLVGEVEGLIVIVVDDSIVEGTQTLARIYLIKKAGAKDVYLLIETPKMQYPCPFEITKRGDLMAATHSHEDMERKLGVKRLGFNAVEDYREAVLFAQSKERKEKNPITEKNICLGCFTGEFPVYPTL